MIIPTTEICGTCRFAHIIPQDMALIECRGVPPTPCVLGLQQTIRGNEYVVELMPPRLPRGRQGCALWATERVQ